MTFEITLTFWPLVIIVGSALLFLSTTYLCFLQGLFDGSDTFGIGSAFVVLFYAVLWVVPSLLAWALWATFRA